MVINYFYIPGLKINTSKLRQVSEAPVRQRSSLGKGMQIVSDEVLAETHSAECKCEDVRYMASLDLPPLHAGMLVTQLVDLESGCTKRKYVCPRLDKVRRRYGK